MDAFRRETEQNGSLAAHPANVSADSGFLRVNVHADHPRWMAPAKLALVAAKL
ncbi:hypothetical protein ABH944_008140 [Caballeronia udeis]|uniref:Uncharacterized protein n=1 Tax=Caballeronia udeis TaxID=1232866 RepID=A0ABW8MVZ3_9BURK